MLGKQVAIWCAAHFHKLGRRCLLALERVHQCGQVAWRGVRITRALCSLRNTQASANMT